MATARKLPSGNYRVRIYAGRDETGKAIYESFTAKTKREAESAAAKSMLNSGAQPRNKMTVGEAIDRYIASKEAVLSPATVREYRQSRRNYLRDIMGARLCELTQEMVQIAVGHDAKSKSPKTLRNAHGLLSAALAVYLPEFNLRTALPQKRKTEMIIPDDTQITQIMLDTRGTPMELAIVLAACLGLRRSEICALTWADIDMKRRTARINKALVLDDNHEWVEKQPKSYAGNRTVDIPGPVYARLEAIKDRNGRLVDMRPDSVTYFYTKLRDKYGFKFRFHDLRAYNASVMLALGIPDKYAMEIMGHATPNMLKTVYQHTMQGKKAEVKNALDAYFNQAYATEYDTNTE